MSRRIEITVPNESDKPKMVVELKGVDNTLFLITIPGPAVGSVLETFRKNGFGVKVGRIVLSSIDYLKPDLSKPLALIEDESNTNKAAAKLAGFQQFIKARKTTEELYNEISNNANMTINTWMNLIGASIMAAGGLTTNATVFIVAAMLVSPIMGPILGITFGYRVADWPLFKAGVINELKMAAVTFLCGVFFGLILGDVGNTYKWPNSAMMPEGQAFNLIISIIVSAAAGTVLGVSLTSTGGNALVGTAISAGLLPPLVNAGMLIAYSMTYAPKDQQKLFYSTGSYSVTFYFTHVVTIVIVANLIFWLKDIDPRFRVGEDSNFDDIDTLVEHRRRLRESGLTNSEQAKAQFFIKHIKDDVTDMAYNLKDKATDFASLVTGGLVGGAGRRRRSSVAASDNELDLESNSSTSNTWHPFKTDAINKPIDSDNSISSSNNIKRNDYTTISIDDNTSVSINDEETGEGVVINPIIQSKSL
eukprot:gene18629-24364_t